MALSKPDALETVRFQFVGEHKQRPATAGAFLTGKDQRFVNYIPIHLVNPGTDKKTFWLIKRPGHELVNTPSTGNIGTSGIVWEGVGSGATIISAFGATNSTIYEGTTSLGAITGWARPNMIEVDFTGTASIVIAASGSKAYFYPTAGSLTEITDADYPGGAGRTTVGSFVSMDGYLFIMDSTGRIYNSDLNSITAWTSTSFIEPTSQQPFNGVGLARHHNSVVAFGKSAIEFYGNAGNADGSPLERIQTPLRMGSVLPASYGTTIIEDKDDVYFIGMMKSGSSGVYRIRNFKSEHISTPIIDAQIEVAEPQNCTLSCARIWGQTLLFMICGTVTFVYNTENDIWFEYAAGSGGILWSWFMNSNQGDGRCFSLSFTDTGGKVYEVNTDTPVYTDDSDSYTATIITNKLDFEVETRKRFHKIALIGDKQSAATSMSITWSDDDYGTFNTARTVDMANDRTYLTNCGAARRRAFQITNSSATPVRLEALEIMYSKLSK